MRLPAGVVVLLMALGSTSAVAAPAVPEISVVNNESQPVFSLDDAITEVYSVETGLDTDSDGVVDRVYAEVVRPKEGQAGLKSPVVMHISPYNEGYSDGWTPPVEQHPDAGPGFGRPAVYSPLAGQFVPLGYAFMQVQIQGTGRSAGCVSLGGDNDIRSMAAVVDWLNGKGRAFHLDGSPARASWSTGAVGTVGHSYDGTIPIGMAAAGVKGLRTLVSTAPISNWYAWTRDHGTVNFDRNSYMGRFAKEVAGPDAKTRCAQSAAALGAAEASDTGDMNAFWDERNYLRDMSRFTAPALTTRALGDYNVSAPQFSRLWEALGRQGVPRKLWMHQGDHHTPPPSGRYADYDRMIHRWMDHWLLGLNNGIMNEPTVDVQREDSETWQTQNTWPHKDMKPVRLFSGPMVKGIASLGRMPAETPQAQRVVPDVDMAYSVASATPVDSLFRLYSTTEVLKRDVHLSGTPEMSILMTPSTTSTPLTALLVSYAEGDEMLTVLSQSAIDVKNHSSLYKPENLVAGRPYRVKWDMKALDRVVPAGHRLGLVVLANYQPYTIIDPLAGPFDIDLDASSLTLPVVGGYSALGMAG